jgi:hypothetical protein
LVKALLDDRLDLVNGRRVDLSSGTYRRGHRFGNWALTGIVRAIFGKRFNDMLSGYKVFSRRFVKTFPGLSRGFDIEAELTIHALELDMPVTELPVSYRERPKDSPSKLSTFRDGTHILWTIVRLIRAERPLPFFGALFALLSAVSVLLAVPIAITYVETGLVPRFPTAILATGLMLLSFLSLACGLILHNVARGQREMKRLAYLAASAAQPRVSTTPAKPMTTSIAR